jgi:D-sedoheptulose 7-phosphate isomerase
MLETDSQRLYRSRIEDSIAVSRALLGDEHVAFAGRVAAVVTRALQHGGKVLLCGNGGSAADATHLAAELVGRFMLDRPPFPALSLSDNGSVVTAIANDDHFANVFARQVCALGRPGDVLIALSTSGASQNVLAAIEAAREVGLSTVGFTGRSGSALANSVDHCLCVPADETARVQEGYMLVGHTICELVERALVGQA